MKITPLIFLLFSGFVAMAQGPQVDLPWMPARDTNHIKTIRHYDYDTVTLARKLVSTWEYDRHGYWVGKLDSLTFNEQGLLTRRVALERHSNAANPIGLIDTASIWDISYSSDGVVQHIKNVFYGTDYGNGYGREKSIDTYEPISHRSHPSFGLLEYICKRCHSSNTEPEYCDTLFFRREYDDKGHLLRQYTNYWDNLEDITYHYRPDGRMEYRVGYYYEWSDSLYYHYDDQGVLTHMTGMEYDLGMEAEIFLRCHPDGRPMEARLKWRVYDDDDGIVDDGDTEIREYDSHGLLLRYRREGLKYPDWEREIDYWE